MLKLYNMWKNSAEKWSDIIAVVEKDRKINYEELDVLVDRLSDNLAYIGVKTGNRVAIHSNNSINYIVCMLASWKIGATIVPIMNQTPIARVEYIVGNSAVSFIIIDDKAAKDKFKLNNKDITTIYLSELVSKNIKKSNLKNDTQFSDNELAYIMYTSGTSGVPKGAMIEQNSVINLLDWYTTVHNINVGTNIANLASIGFDVSMEEILGTLFRGGTLFVPHKKEKTEKNLFRNFIDSNLINIIQLVPSLLDTLVGENPKLNSLMDIICGGETMSEELKNKILLKGYNLFNHYGPTEATVDTTYSRCELEEAVNIGYPIANAECFIIDENGKLHYRNCEGEMYISGAGLAVGYVNNETATEESFRIINGKRAYKTGDYVQINDKGRIYFKGRKDTQIELNGVRIEISEIENYIKKEKLLSNFSVCINSDNSVNELILFYVSDKEINVHELTAKLILFLPNNMIPKKFIRVEQLPVLENGKLIRRLNSYDTKEPQNNTQNTGETYDETTALVINKLSEIIEKKPSELSPNSNLSNIGFESITFVRTVVELEELFDIEFEDDMLQFQNYTTISRIIDYVNKLLNGKGE